MVIFIGASIWWMLHTVDSGSSGEYCLISAFPDDECHVFRTPLEVVAIGGAIFYASDKWLQKLPMTVAVGRRQRALVSPRALKKRRRLNRVGTLFLRATLLL